MHRLVVPVRTSVLAAIVAATVACSGAVRGAPSPSPSTESAPTETTVASASPAPVTPTAAVVTDMPTDPSDPTDAGPPPEASPADAIVAIRVESRVDGVPGSGFREVVESTLTDPRGWRRAGFVFVFDDPDPPYRLVLAEGDEVDALCLPLDTGGRYSCQNGPVVALNADRWRSATPQWTGTLEAYRTMLVNHEVGHLLHLHHPRPQCPGTGLPAPVMAQQSTELGACLANPWPLQWEVDLAARRAEPLAPPPEHDVDDHRPSPPPATS